MSGYTIGDLATETGVKIPTIRYYEGIGLLPPPPRTSGNQRRYDATALERLRFIAHARAMGFPMLALRDMLRLTNHRDAPCEDLDALVRARLADVEQRLARLTALQSELRSMLDSHDHGTVADCRILEVLSDHHNCTHAH
jgi:DNA-binding transcriptional MerR regulator